MIQGTYFTFVESTPGKYRKTVCKFNYYVWMDTFCHTVCCMLHMCPQLGVRCLSDGISWNMNGTPKLKCEADTLEY